VLNQILPDLLTITKLAVSDNGLSIEVKVTVNGSIKIFDFHRGKEAVDSGYEAAIKALNRR
jgi:hypothetical protein